MYQYIWLTVFILILSSPVYCRIFVPLSAEWRELLWTGRWGTIHTLSKLHGRAAGGPK